MNLLWMFGESSYFRWCKRFSTKNSSIVDIPFINISQSLTIRSQIIRNEFIVNVWGIEQILFLRLKTRNKKAYLYNESSLLYFRSIKFLSFDKFWWFRNVHFYLKYMRYLRYYYSQYLLWFFLRRTTYSSF